MTFPYPHSDQQDPRQYQLFRYFSPNDIKYIAWKESRGHGHHGVSSAGALGEMQMKPIALKELQRRYPDLANITEKELLSNPKLNVQLGSMYLDHMVDQVLGYNKRSGVNKPADLNLAVLSYKIGPTAVFNMLDQLPTDKRDWFHLRDAINNNKIKKGTGVAFNDKEKTEHFSYVDGYGIISKTKTPLQNKLVDEVSKDPIFKYQQGDLVKPLTRDPAFDNFGVELDLNPPGIPRLPLPGEISSESGLKPSLVPPQTSVQALYDNEPGFLGSEGSDGAGGVGGKGSESPNDSFYKKMLASVGAVGDVVGNAGIQSGNVAAGVLGSAASGFAKAGIPGAIIQGGIGAVSSLLNKDEQNRILAAEEQQQYLSRLQNIDKGYRLGGTIFGKKGNRLIKKQRGGGVNTTGYTPGYDTINNDYNIIPGSNITTKDTPFDLLGISDKGEVKYMPKGVHNIRFKDANYVTEIPLKAQLGGGDLKEYAPPVGAGLLPAHLRESRIMDRKSELDYSLKRFESRFMEKFWDKTKQLSMNLPEDSYEADAIRHAGSAMYVASNQGPLISPFKVTYTNLLGLAHELSEPGSYEDTKMDLYNNLIGSLIGGLPISITDKERLLKKAFNKDWLSIPSEDAIKNRKNKTKTKYGEGGFTPVKAQQGLITRDTIRPNNLNDFLFEKYKRLGKRPDYIVHERSNKNKKELTQLERALKVVDDVLSAPARGVTKVITGKYQDPSEAFGYKNPQGFLENAANIGIDVLADPMNLLGVGAVKTVAKSASKLSKAADASKVVDVSKVIDVNKIDISAINHLKSLNKSKNLFEPDMLKKYNNFIDYDDILVGVQKKYGLKSKQAALALVNDIIDIENNGGEIDRYVPHFNDSNIFSSGVHLTPKKLRKKLTRINSRRKEEPADVFGVDSIFIDKFDTIQNKRRDTSYWHVSPFVRDQSEKVRLTKAEFEELLRRK